MTLDDERETLRRIYVGKETDDVLVRGYVEIRASTLERRKQVLDGPLDLVSAQLQKCSKAGAAAILSPPLAFGQPQGPNAGPRLTQSIVFAQLSRFPRRCDVAGTYWGVTLARATQAERG